MQNEFAVGQRWLSETEIELGLGLVTALSGRQVTILFPANGESRAYAIADAPLTRYRLEAEETARHSDGWSFTVTEVESIKQVLTYHGHHDGQVIAIPETQLHFQVQLSGPLTRLLTGQIDRLSHYQLRQQATQALQQWLARPVRGLAGARIDLLPHQLYVAHTVANRPSPRVLLADEVGLGKTIEAGLVIQSKLLNGDLSRALIIVPDPLLHQWMIELRRRFNLPFSIVDESFCAATDDDENPFTSVQLALVPTSLLNSSDHTLERLPQAVAASWDLIIVDEAHQLDDKGREAIRQFGEHSGLLLLTATPDQNGIDSHFAQLQLLDRQRFHDIETFREEQLAYQKVAEQAEMLEEDSEELNRLLDEHGTGRVLFRNTRANVSGFPRREYSFHPLTTADEQINWLHKLAKDHSQEKMLVIMHSAQQVEETAAQLRIRFGRHCALFHEQMTLLERDRTAAFFADSEDGAQLLLSSEIGGEGRNFQFARHLVMFDLPEHPDRLEQRIGRLDRIGQLEQFTIHVAATPDSRMHRLARWYDEGMQAFTQPNATGYRLLELVGEQLESGLTGNDDDFSDLLNTTRNAVAEIRTTLAAGRDRLLERNACRPATATYLTQQLKKSDNDPGLITLMFSFWDQFGIICEEKDASRLVLRPGPQFNAGGLPGLDEEGTLVTFDRATALVYDDIQFLTWEHPQVQSALNMLLTESHGSACVALLKNKALPAGHWLLELSVRASLPQAPAPGLEQQYPTAPLRLLLDPSGRDMSSKVSASTLDQQLHIVPRKSAVQMVKALRKELQAAVKQALPVAENALRAQCQQDGELKLNSLRGEAQRLRSLQTRNPSIRHDEIEAFESRADAWLKAFSDPQIHLDAVRLIINVGADN